MPFIEQLPFNPSDPKNTTELCSLVAKACDVDVPHQFCWQANRFNPLYDNDTAFIVLSKLGLNVTYVRPNNPPSTIDKAMGFKNQVIVHKVCDFGDITCRTVGYTVDITDAFMFDKALRLAVCVVAALLALNTTDK